MKKIYALALLAMAFAGGKASAQSDAEMKAWETYMTPGAAHKMMATETGTWYCDMTFWQNPDTKPEKASTTAEIKMIMGGRYQQSAYTGNVMGMPFEGHGVVAFDNATKEYISTWIDNMGTGMMVMKGKMNPDGKTMVLTGEMVDPVEGKPVKCREVYTIVDNDTRKMEMYDLRSGKEFKTMEIIMKRKK
ncbi:hypothetical protein CHU92_10800 [Flavobacterium cyanobacteriorum]|uniref:DUF1579 domain-containing protein n=1 Tax=Flavobacterium cyanobacteriorum TaxID=2022802 RepID=A0A255Z1S5_9FLAO|nr:DUF1579 domain-containing protein [Flavobacterium cyanobacteriorum]OYQ35457.1 hypothetical protein CHU92_10800 [Flavobacterium cyanobacteriorum]